MRAVQLTEAEVSIGGRARAGKGGMGGFLRRLGLASSAGLPGEYRRWSIDGE